jgi:hypothetical protein
MVISTGGRDGKIAIAGETQIRAVRPPGATAIHTLPGRPTGPPREVTVRADFGELLPLASTNPIAAAAHEIATTTTTAVARRLRRCRRRASSITAATWSSSWC